jgi:hypothetical protein
MNELNFKSATTTGLTGDKSVAITTLDAPAPATTSPRADASARRRRLLNATRFTLEDTGFRLFRVY